MNKKGFTLIELLAVIVILAIIALIATPIITGIVANVKKGGAESSALGWIDAVEKQSMVNMLDDNSNTLTDGTYNVSNLDIKVKGEKPKSGWVKIEQGQVKDYSLVIGEYTVTPKDNNPSKAVAVKGNNSETIIYRFSSDSLYNGDKIDLKNRKYTNYTKWDDNQKKLVSTNETHDMVGIYSTILDDVLTITTEIDGSSVVSNYDGTPIESRSNPVYLKHTINKDGIIKDTEVCGKYNGKDFCLQKNDDTSIYEQNKTLLTNIFGSDKCHVSIYPDNSGQCFYCDSDTLGATIYDYLQFVIADRDRTVKCYIDKNDLTTCAHYR